MVIQHNIPALNSHRNLLVNNSATAKNLEKLSSGYRINRAGDDAAGLAISEKMRGQIRGLAMAENNVSMGINLIQTAEGGLQETHAILQRMRELAVQASNGTYDDDDRANLQMEIDELNLEIDRIAESTSYNGINLLNGDLGTDLKTFTYSGAWPPPVGWTDGDIFSSFTTTAEPSALSGVSFDIQMTPQGKFEVIAANATVTGSGNNWKVEFTSGANNGLELEFTIDPTHFGKNIGDMGKYTVDFDTTGTAGNAVTFNADAFLLIDDYGPLVAGAGQGVLFQIGCNGGNDQLLECFIDNMSSGALGVNAINIADPTLANQAIDTISDATNTVSAQRAQLGAYQNRLEHTLNNLGVTKENLTASESTIRDVDMAKEMMEFTKNNILVQSAQAMLAQATQLPQGVLQLLR